MSKTQETKKFAFMGILVLALLSYTNASFPYYGTKIGSLKRLHHGVSGDVYAVDSRTIFVKNFNYDGEAPAAYFYVGNTNKPSNDGAARLRDERGGTTALTRRYRNKDITLSLPDGKTLSNIKWFSVWCDEFAVNFGDVAIPSNLDYPRPQKINALKGVHGVSSEQIVIVDAQTLLVPNFSYDGEAPDAKFWVGRGTRPTAQGLRIPDENGTENPMRRYDRKTIVLTLPGDLTIFDIGHFGVWCEAFTVDFGHVRIPEGLNVPPSLKMLGISPQSKLNCEVLYDDLAFEVRWAVAGESIVVQLVAKLAKDEYMSFGISPSKDRTEMIGADVVVAWVDQETGKGFAQDYFLDDKSQCSGGRGTCPDVNLQDNTNSIRLLNAAMVNGYSIVTYQRSLQATDKYDLPISVNSSQAIVWAIGPLNERKEASFHSHFTKRTHLIDFGRQPTWNCPMPEGSTKPSGDSDENTEQFADNGKGYTESNFPRSTTEPEEEFYDNRAQALQQNRRQQNRRPESTTHSVATPKPASTSGAWDIPAIQCYEPEDGVFYAQMGPTGGKHGYPAITGHVGWGISWYINGLLIPEIHVVRGKTYTFVVEGGNNPDIPAKYHPFYITDDPIGGYEHKRDEEKQAVHIYAGVTRSRTGKITPIGVGRLCNWTPDVDGPPADDFQSFGAYQRTLTLKCDPGEPGVITWKPDSNTPDTVYYHCFTHRYLGWKIHVHDKCDDVPYAASEKHEIKVPAVASPYEEDIAAESSIRHETKVSPNDNFLLKHQTDLIKNHNMNGTPPKLTFEITKSTEITKLISDGIRAAEALEESILRSKQTTVYSGAPASQFKQTPSNPSQPSQKHQLSQLPSVHANAIPPQRPLVPTAEPATLHGETHIHQQHQPIHLHISSQLNTHSLQSPTHHQYIAPHHHHHNPNNFTNLPAQSQKTIGLSEYLLPPQNAPLFRPVKLPGRRPFPAPIKKTPQTKPVLPQQLHRHPALQQAAASIIPQPSVIVNHYRKPVPGILKPFVKEPAFPIQPIAASVLLLGQPTELGNQRKADGVLHSKPKTVIPVPYGDLVPQDSMHLNTFHTFTSNTNNNQIDKNANYLTKPLTYRLPEKAKPLIHSHSVTVPAPVFKKPFDIHEVKEEPASLDIATMKPAINNGFKPDSVVVEIGFRPIIRQQLDVINSEQIAHRREDPGSEIDEVMETDTLFLTAQKDTQSLNFEPMFIPSPPDSTNATIIRKIIASSPVLSAALPLTAAVDKPEAAKLRKPILEDILNDPHGENDNLEPDLDLDMVYDEVTTKNEQNSDEPENKNTKYNMDLDTDQLDEEVLIAEEDDHFDDIKYDDEDNDDEDDKEAQAAERIDTYYLPPDNRKIPHSTLPSGAVVTYDGKAVVDTSLVLPPKLEARGSSNARLQNHGLSKIEELVRNTPQFRPFRGEIPPPIPDFLSAEKSLRLANNPLMEFSNRLLMNEASSSTPSTTSSSSQAHPSSLRPISTKLHSLKNLT